MNRLDSYPIQAEKMMTKNKRRRLVTEQDVEAALQLIQLKNHHQNITRRIHEPFMKIVLKSKEFLKAQDKIHHDDDENNICNGGYGNIRKRKSDGIASCSSSITFDLDDSSSDEDATEAVGSVKKMKKFRPIVDIYNVTMAL